MGDLTLHQFAYSHFNEKARWAMDLKGLAHNRETYLPGPHMPAIRKMTGQTSTPVLQEGDAFVVGSAQIIDHLEQTHPTPPLYPEDPDLQEEALAVQRALDEQYGPAVRTVLFSVFVREGGYLTRMFGGSKSLPKRLAYRAMFPVAKSMIAKGNGVTPDNVVRCEKVTLEQLDELARSVAGTGYLVGAAFSVADLTAAALTAPIAGVEHPDMKRPQPMPERVRELIERYADHEAIAWVNEMYRKHRK